MYGLTLTASTCTSTAADPGGHLVMGDLAELLLAMPEAEHADET